MPVAVCEERRDADMTLAEIERLDKDFLTVAEVAGCIHCEPQLIRDEAGKDPKYLGFPITKIGRAVQQEF